MSLVAKEFTVGAVIGILISGIIWYFLGSSREELEALNVQNEKLEVEVKKGIQLKASYEVLKKEVEEQQQRIEELIKLFPTDAERSRVAYLVQKLASASALGQVQGWVNSDKPIKTEYYMEYPTTYKYLGGFHEFGRFLSNVSGYEKIINISDIVMTRDSGKGRNTAAIEFRLSTYVYDKSQGKPKAPVASAPVAAPSKGKDED